MGDVQKFILAPMVSLYGSMDTDDVDLVLDLYERTLGRFRDEQLKAGFDAVAGSFFPSKRQQWPVPARFVEAINEASERQSAQGAATLDKARQEIWWKQEQSKRWARDWLRSTPLGRQSLAEGWCRALHNLVWQTHWTACLKNQPIKFEDIRLPGEDVAYMKDHQVSLLSPGLEASIVLREPSRIETENPAMARRTAALTARITGDRA